MRHGLAMYSPRTHEGVPTTSLPPGLPSTHLKTLTILENNKKCNKKKQRKNKSPTSQHKLHQTRFPVFDLPPNSPYFHQKITEREKGSLCFLFQNVNSLHIKDPTAMRLSLSFMKEAKVAYLGLQETGLNANHPDCITGVRKAFHERLPWARTYPTSNKTFWTNTRHQPGGLLSAVMRPLSASSTTIGPTTTSGSSISLKGFRLGVSAIFQRV